ncbi:MAG: NAD-dependent dehydratase [Candidatus Buchananbacteria bacterium RIFCSPHIGHO2_01_FULL_39_14]|uniref:UDP-glucuronate decarboxylase n=2 Tax=Candidatus Buchananiibacteriota TaxID=1817903 RepID=A0A1G1YMD1_9BACT|nr:MAG: NAD-dependent dehydratase [Candidatus Buchananbacteria bacterium RIFCSPHIGHO2_01_FULL_39_14]OGY48398.1 MAG: NAD-dependent dehydratase [Candidatus Buchananbacteria bacterium RIFCSPHIGHO2_02_FULL_39_17]OGY53434.1 MAG: NAD-dependent dehydratase [Candidatus Buchananbacteria bacterium RIFCSPLOWO2_01_FULL_40_23b]
MRILVTGGAGFIGSHLCQFLLEKGHQIICLDNFFTGQKRNIDQLLTNKNFELLEHDITKSFDVKVDQIYNLACPASPVYYQKTPIKTVQTNVLGAINCLELSKKLGGVKVLQASTSEVYGDPQIHPQPENYNGNVNPTGPRACYDEGKRCAETLFFDYYREAKIPIKVVRIFNTYGPNMSWDDGRVVSNFITQALKGQDITIYGEGNQTRSFCYVSDMVLGLYKMMASDSWTGPVNLGNPGEFTVKELSDKIISKTKSQSKIVYRPLPADDPKQRRPDISLAKQNLNWQPTIPLDEGLDKTIEYFKKVI